MTGNNFPLRSIIAVCGSFLLFCSASLAQQAGVDAQSMFNKARLNGDVAGMIQAAELQEMRESSLIHKAGDVSAAEMVDFAMAGTMNGVSYEELLQMFDVHTWELLPGRPVLRRRPMPVKGQTEFQFKVASPSDYALRVASRKERARYSVEVHSADGRLLCGTTQAAFEFSCNFSASAPDLISVTVVSLGPFDSSLEVQING